LAYVSASCSGPPCAGDGARTLRWKPGWNPFL